MGSSSVFLLFFFFFPIITTLVYGQSESSLPAPVIPLAVKSPYLNAWVAAANGSSPGAISPTFWTTQRQLGWAGFVRVDGQTFQWLGKGGTAAKALASYVTPTRSIFTMAAGSLEFNITFLSPIEPEDWNKQSFPFSYLYIDAKSSDSMPHTVQFYSDISGEWASSDNNNVVQWNTTDTGSSVLHQMQRTSMQPMVETNEMAEDGTVYYSMAKRPDMTWQTGTDVSLRGRFTGGSLLQNIQDTNFRTISPNWPVLAFAVDLGNITQTSTPLVWAIGVVRDPLVRYVKGTGVEVRSSYFRAKYDSINAALDDFLADFDNAKTRALTLDNKIMSDGAAVSTQYADLLAISLRQTMASMDITIGRDDNGKWNTSDVKIFMKDIGTGRRVNAVETLYASFPALLYLNASFTGPLLEPLLEYQASPQYHNSYAAADLGSSYPDALGNNTDIPVLGVENCGNMLIMAYAHAQKSGDGSLVARYYDLLKKWTDFLVANSLHTNGYTSADGQVGPDMSNLAIKGITGIFAMSKISEVVRKSDMVNYRNKATQLETDWEGLAYSSNHITTDYGVASSWSLIYNLYAARLVNLPVNDQLYKNQDAFYASQASTAPRFGFAYDTNDNGRAKSQWTIFTAGTTTNSTTRDLLVSMVHERAFYNASGNPFPTTYDSVTGRSIPLNGRASPAQGAMFSLLALNTPNKAITLAGPSSKGGPNVPAIVGAIIGVVVLIAIIGLAYFLWKRRQRRRSKWDYSEKGAAPFSISRKRTSVGVLDDNQPIEVTPYIVDAEAAAIAARQSSGTDSLYQNGYSKAREAQNGSKTYLLPGQRPGLSAAGSSYSGTSEGGGSSYYVPSTTSGVSSELRVEVEELRREMAEIRAQRLQDEPPPMYQDPPPGNIASSSAQTSEKSGFHVV
ncbi:hypothetical protein BDQ12DRAFT_683316 [Crucibulum laeve]|uniref:DUF1793-domain-containing protein n=1 Tax=Crucibulum laeve TaxID=68775 RepID=A0A5C3M321_9AGAR|nr:hypothetical protein BDQ12DRAFT_683316 [Crucibulum laeve]